MKKFLLALTVIAGLTACGGGGSGGTSRDLPIANGPAVIVDECGGSVTYIDYGGSLQPRFTTSDVSYSRTQGDYDVYDVQVHGYQSVFSQEVWVTRDGEIHGEGCPFQNAPGQPLPE